MASIVRCPHCFIDVLPKPDGSCPACKANTRYVDPAKRDLVAAEFVDGERLPKLCYLCGQPSASAIECGLRNEPRGPDGAGVMARVLGAIGGSLLVSRREEFHKEFALSVELPVCSRHEGLEPPKPLYADRNAYRLTFAVHQHLDESRLKPRR